LTEELIQASQNDAKRRKQKIDRSRHIPKGQRPSLAKAALHQAETLQMIYDDLSGVKIQQVVVIRSLVVKSRLGRNELKLFGQVLSQHRLELTHNIRLRIHAQPGHQPC